MSRIGDDILSKALRCLDEVRDENDPLNSAFFPLDKFLNEAGRGIVNIVPLRALGRGESMDVATFKPLADGSGYIELPHDFLRLLRFKMDGWQRTATTCIYNTDARYAQMFNKTLRGGEVKPIVVICKDIGRLEYYSSRKGVAAKILEAQYFGFTEVDDTYPEKLIDITAWKLAEIVMSVSNDALGIQICSGKVNEHLQLL